LRYSVKRLVTDFAKKLADEITSTDSSDWWFEKNEELWVNGPETSSENK
jgi:putative hydrolase of HD superfamily